MMVRVRHRLDVRWSHAAYFLHRQGYLPLAR